MPADVAADVTGTGLACAQAAAGATACSQSLATQSAMRDGVPVRGRAPVAIEFGVAHSLMFGWVLDLSTLDTTLYIR